MADEDYRFWRNALAGQKQAVTESEPQCGFYKRRTAKDGPWLPIAFFRRNGKIVCGFRGELVDPLEHWTYAAKNPVHEKPYRIAVATGRWPDEPAPASIGHNLPDDPFEALKAEVDDKIEQALSWLAKVPKAPTENDANLARNLQAQLLAFNKRADAMHKGEKQPHLDASRAVDAKFEFRKSVADVAARLRSVFEAFMRAEEARQRAEKQRQYQEELRKAEEARAAAEAERAQLERDDPILAVITPIEPLTEMPKAPEPVVIQVGGGVGRKAGLKTVYEPVIKDFRAALLHFEDHADVRTVIEKLVRADVRLHKTKTTVPGVDVTEERRAA